MLLTIGGIVLFLGFWVGTILHVGPLGRLPGFIAALVSVAYGYLARRWWAPLVILCALPALAYPEAYGDNQPDYSNGIFAAIIGFPLVMACVALGVLLAKLTQPLTRSRRAGDTTSL
ncbi:MAG: hypothetical protein DLM61_00030 [Pseudonocardiales bacterium]|nr:MAG: hypothetical protein DLM61_00030 [Pseudonocardiales bacterium]